MPNDSLIIDPSADGPKYNEDATILEPEKTPLVEEKEEEEEEEETLEDEEVEENEDEDEEKPPVEEEDEDEKSNVIPFDRPSIKEIKAQFPEIFTKFPALKESYFREIEFTKLFPTVDDAKEAFQENEAFTVLSDAILSGDSAPLLDSVEKADAKSLEILSLSFLPTLYKKNQDLYSQAVTPLFQNLVRSLYHDKDDNTKNAALVLAEFLFGSDGEGVAKGTKSVAKSLQLSEEQKKLKETKEANLSTAFRASTGRVQETVNKSMESLVLKSGSYDPNKVFSPFLRKQGAQEVIRRVMKALESDNGHMQVMAARWKRARANGFTSDDESKIISTYLARAKSLIPDACSKVSAAMLGTKKKAADDKRARVGAPARTENNSGRAAGQPRSNNNGHVDYDKMSDIDILAS